MKKSLFFAFILVSQISLVSGSNDNTVAVPEVLSPTKVATQSVEKVVKPQLLEKNSKSRNKSVRCFDFNI